MGALVRIRIDLAYDGGRYRGFAAQPGLPTVEGELTAALRRLADAPLALRVAGRTDKGVHALHQVVHTDVPAESRILRDLDRARRALDMMCGPAIAVWRIRRVTSSFDARFSATQRRYRYRLCDADALDPLERHVTWHVGPPALDARAMHEAGARLLGDHDFSSFCRRAGDQHLRRRLDELAVRRRPRGVVEMSVAGPAFCHQMVRSVVGCLLRVGRGERPPSWVTDVLAARDRQAVGQVAPPHGLVLVGVRYGVRGGAVGRGAS